MHKYTLLAAIAWAWPTAPAAAAQALPAPQNDIVITATRSARPLIDVPASVSVVGRAEIEGTPGKTLDDILRRVPSVDLPAAASYQLHPTALDVSMRGLGGTRALVLLDGVPLNDPFFGYVQWSQVPLATVDRVEVVRGGGATLWGNYAMGGVINILTRPPDKTEFLAEAAGGSYGTYRANGYIAWRVDEGLRVGVDAGINHTDGFEQVPRDERGPIDVPTAFTAHNAAITGDIDVAPGLTARLRASYFDNHQTLQTRLGTNYQRTWRYTGSVTRQLGARGSLALTLFHDDSRFRTDNTRSPDGAPPRTAEYVQNRHRTPEQDIGGSLVWDRQFGGWLHHLSAGLDYHGIRGADYADIFDETGARLRTDIGRGKQRFVGGFVQASIRPTQPLELLLSVRYQHFYNYAGLDRSPGGKGAVPSRHDSDLDPRLSIRYALGGGLAVRGAVYRAFRAPTLDNLYRAYSNPGGIFYGNPALRPETLEGGEVGVDIDRGPLRVQATAFASRIKDVITSRALDAAELPPGFSFGTRAINAGQARSRGVELEADLTLSPVLSATFGYTYADSVVTRNPEDPASIGVQQVGVPRNRASIGVDWTAPAGFKLSPRLRYVSRINGDADGNHGADPHLVADLAGSVPLTKRLETFVEIENLFGNHYIVSNNGTKPPLLGTPFTATAGVRLKLD